MNKYEAMVIMKPDLNEEARTTLCKQTEEQITKNQGIIESAKVWAEKYRIAFRIKKFDDGLYYVINFQSDPLAIVKIKQAWRLNDNILRFLILKA